MRPQPFAKILCLLDSFDALAAAGMQIVEPDLSSGIFGLSVALDFYEQTVPCVGHIQVADSAAKRRAIGHVSSKQSLKNFLDRGMVAVNAAGVAAHFAGASPT